MLIKLIFLKPANSCLRFNLYNVCWPPEHVNGCSFPHPVSFAHCYIAAMNQPSLSQKLMTLHAHVLRIMAWQETTLGTLGSASLKICKILYAFASTEGFQQWLAGKEGMPVVQHVDLLVCR